MYIYCNIQVLSFNHRYSGKAMIVTKTECVFLALSIKHATCMRHTVICDFPGSTKFSTLSHKRQDFLKKKVTEKMPVF
jgi:hypothetical protein